MKTKYILLLCIPLLIFAACQKKQEQAKEMPPPAASASPYTGSWVNAADHEFIQIRPDGSVDSCGGVGPDLGASEGTFVKLKGDTAVNIQDGVVIYNFKLDGNQLMVDGKPYVKGELSQECKDLLSTP